MCTCVWTRACTRVLSLNHGKHLARELLVSWCSREEDGLLSSLLGQGNGCGSSGEPQLGDLTLHCSTCCEMLSLGSEPSRQASSTAAASSGLPLNLLAQTILEDQV